MTCRFPARGHSKTAVFLENFRLIFVAIFVPFGSNYVFQNFFRLFNKKLRFVDFTAKLAYFNSIFYQGHVIV